ncbi:ABC transporter ATP-binding protein [Fusibacter ferrireducens]|uniref:ABC transporter ATP-binding protein n=1 Tax=Fusibacter ferrireducens TaxID=2785058 RepID=A0ABR9ZRL8_9FIRM|nr:ABC transporter ATP-binding protein [Fusibacter ferrireducens]MBF4692793.1 ABC transporter ATP-binding protein [Fusibacter ferrireducens]
MGELIIEVKDLRKVYKIGSEKVVALNKINLSIYKGEICCILGTSGSGKSTLLNMMAGLEKPTKGSIEIKSVGIEKMTEKQLARFRQKHIGFIFQSYNLLGALTALENVAMPLIFRGFSKINREKLARKYLNMVGLKDRYKHRPTQMSGGQQQRVGIARAFVGTPEIIFADEPTGNLDTKTSIEVMHIMWKMAREKQQTIVIVTHDPEVALYADKVIHIRDGDIQKIDNRENDDVYEKYILPYEVQYDEHLEDAKVST